MSNVFPIGLDGVAARHVDPLAYDAEDALALIQRAAETVRDLQRTNALLEAREQACRAEFDRDRAQWRDDLDGLRRTVEDCLERAVAAEEQAEEAKASTRLAVQLFAETRAREKAAITSALDAERRLARFHEQLSSEFSQFVDRRGR